MSIAVIVPSMGRRSLGDTVASVIPQLTVEDQLIVEIDWPLSGEFGNYARDIAALKARTTHLWFLDDDDVAEPGALVAMRAAIQEDPTCAWFFRVKCGGGVVWKEERLRSDGQSGQCYLVPKKTGPEWNAKSCPSWTSKPNQHDFQWAEQLQATFGFKWNKAIVADLGVGVRPK